MTQNPKTHINDQDTELKDFLESSFQRKKQATKQDIYIEDQKVVDDDHDL